VHLCVVCVCACKRKRRECTTGFMRVRVCVCVRERERLGLFLSTFAERAIYISWKESLMNQSCPVYSFAERALFYRALLRIGLCC